MPEHAPGRHDRFRVPDDELSWRFSRSSGPGGQHVNTSDTRVEVSWDLASSPALSATQRAQALERLRTRLVDGTLTIASSQYRSQHRNREAARVRLEQVVAAAIVPPRPRRATRPTRGSQQRRIEAKKRRGDVKRSRRRPGAGDTG
ncbi:alternative ribosome rescue aminoacyl-tRNA hydrolase ArfB [Aeromicrobium sp. 50.2.37]|uniref:alternative ribosome rescue aminoacyl-tRNA hydrolase ArfB n=1 Tax=Aeromicrobium sp. 50.2.37 TaxID=2969305 RepID=UPI00214F8741|nr:alternative ribosome rescue aminoacyl-tRNA hydrolase ArfB [Aeromicrobium sp. 50.2.37]MCR4514878.1 aminoacyl-tRNA hydrolase [Aeromicrobium sp. 50.2.37]